MAMEKTFDAAEAEARLTALWDAAGAFRAGANASRPETYCIVIPPPNVTGSLHMGHAFNNTLQDILIRWHRMRGFDTLWQVGTDHAGIATQMVVERELAKTNRRRTDFTRPEFEALVWDQKATSEATILGQLKRLGASCDWDRKAFTMDPNFQAAVIRVFVEMYHHKDADGNPEPLIYRGKRLVNWDPHFETAISDLEVENIEVAGHMWHFKYPLAGGETYEYVEKDAEGNVTLREVRDYIAIATTRPETMLGDGAVAVHPSDERYAPIVGNLCEIPVGPKAERRLIPIITDEYPDPLFGSGAVKITGAHDFNDYGVALRNDIPLYPLMDTRGAMRADDAPDNMVPANYRGMDRFAARAAVVADITAEGLAVTIADADGNPIPHVEAKAIMQPFGDRSKVVIEPMLTDQWFVDTAKIVQPAIDAVRQGRTMILPEQHEKVYFHWLETIEPWCISRQLWWGHQIPVWYGLALSAPGFTDDEGDGALDEVELIRILTDLPATDVPRLHCAASFHDVANGFRDDLAGLPHPLNTATIVEVADRAEAVERLAQGLADYALSQDPTHLAYPVWRDPDVLDTWFSSGLWPIGTLGWPEQTPELAKYFPTNTLVTGFDIIFFWVARMMMMQLAVVNEVPFRTVYVHALVRDEKGKKMSKSLGNVLDPLDLIDEFGADAVRFTLTAMAAMGRDLKLSTARIAGYRNFGTKLWNACRFAEMNGVWENHTTRTAPPQAKATVNRWIIAETARACAAVDAALDKYRFDDAANALYGFVWGRVCDWYVEFAKPLFDGPDADETRRTMAWVLDQCMILLHPFMPFITEDLWQTTGARKGLLAHAAWPHSGADLHDPAAEAELAWVIDLIEQIRSARAQVRVPVGLKLDMLCLGLDAAQRPYLARNAALIHRLARIEHLADATTAPRGALTIAVEGGTFALPLDGVIDIAAETDRLRKTLDKLGKDQSGLRARLANPAFLASAKEEVVDETRDKLDQAEAEAAKLEAALARLAAMA